MSLPLASDTSRSWRVLGTGDEYPSYCVNRGLDGADPDEPAVSSRHDELGDAGQVRADHLASTDHRSRGDCWDNAEAGSPAAPRGRLTRQAA